MKKILILISLFCLLSNRVLAMSLEDFKSLTEEEARTKVKAEAMKEYPDSYSLVKTLVDGNMEAFRTLKRIVSTESGAKLRILENALKEYDYSFSLILTLYEGNVKAMEELEEY